jgi:hypothetical protein
MDYLGKEEVVQSEDWIRCMLKNKLQTAVFA